MGKEGRKEGRDGELFFQSLRIRCDGLMALSISNEEPRKKNPFVPSSGSQIDVNCELTDPVQGGPSARGLGFVDISSVSG